MHLHKPGKIAGIILADLKKSNILISRYINFICIIQYDRDLSAGSMIASGSVISEGTYLTNTVQGEGGIAYKQGTLLEN